MKFDAEIFHWNVVKTLLERNERSDWHRWPIFKRILNNELEMMVLK